MINVTDSFWHMLYTYVIEGHHAHDADEKSKKEIEELVKEYPDRQELFKNIHIMQKEWFVLDGTTGFIKAIQ